MRRAVVVLALLLVGGCRSEEERRREEAEAWTDSLAERTRSRDTVPLEYEDVQLGPALERHRDSVRASADSAPRP